MRTFLSQDDINVYRSSPPLPKITRPTRLLPSAHDLVVQRRQQRAVESADSTIIADSDRSSPSADIEKESSAGGGGSCAEGNSAGSHPKAPRNTMRKCKASSSEEARYAAICV